MGTDPWAPPSLDPGWVPPPVSSSLPHSVEAEMALLGSILVNNKALTKVAHIVKYDDFAYEPHRAIYKKITDIIEAGELADPIVVKCSLNGALDDVGGSAYMAQLADAACAITNAEAYALQIRDLAIRRSFLALGDELRASALAADDPRVVSALTRERVEQIESGRLERMAKAWSPPDPTTIPPRQWLLGTLIVRGEVFGIGGSGGKGKTTIALALALSMATGKALLGVRPRRPLRVLYLTMEEPEEEVDRRLSALCISFGITAEDIGDRLHIATGKVQIADVDDIGKIVGAPDKHWLRMEIKRTRPDAVFADPFRMSYEGEENSNDVINAVIREWKAIAFDNKLGVCVVHHFRKGIVTPGDPDGFRGGVAFIDACRSAATVTSISDEDANRYELTDDERRRIIRLDDAKSNMSLIDECRWIRLGTVRLGNATDDYPEGDGVQVAEPWDPPSAFAGVSMALARDIILAIGRGAEDEERYGRTKSTRWAGHIVCEMAECSEGRAQRMLESWLDSGVLYEDEYKTKQRKKAQGLFVNHGKLPG